MEMARVLSKNHYLAQKKDPFSVIFYLFLILTFDSRILFLK